MEKRTFCNELQPNREQILRAIPSRYEHFQHERKRGGARKDVGYAFVADADGGKQNSTSGTRHRAKGRGRRGRGEHKNHEEGENGDHTKSSGKQGWW